MIVNATQWHLIWAHITHLFIFSWLVRTSEIAGSSYHTCKGFSRKSEILRWLLFGIAWPTRWPSLIQGFDLPSLGNFQFLEAKSFCGEAKVFWALLTVADHWLWPLQFEFWLQNFLSLLTKLFGTILTSFWPSFEATFLGRWLISFGGVSLLTCGLVRASLTVVDFDQNWRLNSLTKFDF